MTRHFYRFDITSELGKLFRRLWNECNKAERAADSFAKKVGAKTYYSSPSAFAGGVECVSFAEGTKVNTKLWHSLGKDGDGLEQWVPDVKQRSDVTVLPRKDFRPSDTATRIYDRRVLQWGQVRHLHTLDEWAAMTHYELTNDRERDAERMGEMLAASFFVRYIELYRNDKVSAARDPRWQLSHVARESIRIERARLTLPVVKMERFHELLQADKEAVMRQDGKPTIIQESTPTFFEYGNRFYLGIDYPCRADGLQEISTTAYAQAKGDLMRMQRDIEALAKSDVKGS